MRLLLAIFFLIVLILSVSGQYIGALEISDDDVKPWFVKLEAEYEGLYHFGESESESDFLLFFVDTLIIGQIKQGYWEEGTGIWKWSYLNLANIKVAKQGNFTSDRYSGQFVTYTDNSGVHKGLKINNPWTDWLEDDVYEIGIRTKIPSGIFAGDYPQVSRRYLTADELSVLDKEHLLIMRNEVFARYGFIFKEGGKMEKFFSQKDWYEAEHKDVTDFLTQLELLNIELIRQFEAKN